MASAKQPETMAEQLMDVIECCICLETPPARIYQCENGHLYCGDCHAKMANCGVCRKPLGNFRCLMAEKFLAIQNGPEIQAIRLKKANGGMGLSIVDAKGIGKDKLGIYVKAVVDNGAAYHDGRLQPGDQLLKVDGTSLVGITQVRAAEIMMHTTGQVVELEVAKQGAIFHGLSALLAQPSPVLSP